MMKLRLRMVRVTLECHVKEKLLRTMELTRCPSSCAKSVMQSKSASKTIQLKREQRRTGPAGAGSDESEYETRYDRNTVNLKAI